MDDTVPTRRVLAGLALVPIALVVLLACPPGCAEYRAQYIGPYIGTTAKSFLMEIHNNPDPNIRYVAYGKLASPNCYDDAGQKAEAVHLLIEKLEGSQEPIASRAVICRALGELRAPEAREPLIKALNDPEPVIKVEACRALGKVGKPEDATIMARIMTVDLLEDCRIAAIESLGELKSNDPRILQMLLAGMEHDDPAIRLASLNALRSITGTDKGVAVAAWRDAVLPKTAAAAPAENAAAATAVPNTPPR